VEYTAESITAYFNLDLGLLRSYSLGEKAFELLVGLGLLKVRRFLSGGTRLRTACDLRTKGEPRVTEPEGFKLPTEGVLVEGTQGAIKACESAFAKPPITEISTAVAWKAKDDKRATEEAAEDNEDAGG
jgi:CRISPR-associated protein Csb1